MPEYYAPHRRHSRRKRHRKLLDRLYALGWTVEACYDPKNVRGCLGSWNRSWGKHVFYQFNRAVPPCQAPTLAPPFRNAGRRLTFVLVQTVPKPGSAMRHVVVGWRGLAEFAARPPAPPTVHLRTNGVEVIVNERRGE